MMISVRFLKAEVWGGLVEKEFQVLWRGRKCFQRKSVSHSSSIWSWIQLLFRSLIVVLISYDQKTKFFVWCWRIKDGYPRPLSPKVSLENARPETVVARRNSLNSTLKFSVCLLGSFKNQFFKIAWAQSQFRVSWLFSVGRGHYKRFRDWSMCRGARLSQQQSKCHFFENGSFCPMTPIVFE